MSIRPLKGISVSILVIILLLGTFNFLTSPNGGGDAVPDSHNTRVQNIARSASNDMWPIYMGDNTHTGYSPIEVPLNNGTLWTTSLPDLKETDAPILYDGIIYIGSGDGRVRGIDPDTGDVVWSVYTGGNNHISVAVTASDGVIYFGADNGRVYAFDIETKAKLWDTNLRMDSILTSPVVADGKLFVGTSNITRSGFFAINITNGDIVWTYHMNDTANFLGIQSHPAYWNGMVYFGDGWGNVFCLDADGFSDGNRRTQPSPDPLGPQLPGLRGDIRRVPAGAHAVRTEDRPVGVAGLGAARAAGTLDQSVRRVRRVGLHLALPGQAHLAEDVMVQVEAGGVPQAVGREHPEVAAVVHRVAARGQAPGAPVDE